MGGGGGVKGWKGRMGSGTGRGIQWLGDRNPTQICNETSVCRETRQVSCAEAGVNTALSYLLYFLVCVCMHLIYVHFPGKCTSDIVHESNCFIIQCDM